ncbi:hypothetical protein AGMMS50293_26210 [Spirochaetia bacterium]|nr:hypothetical protein AGMMS50293_26210 [Spirochaetia bacterium]
MRILKKCIKKILNALGYDVIRIPPRKGYKKPKRDLLRMTYNLTNHCNLNCKCCDNFAPLVEEEFTDLEIFKRDLKRIAALSNMGKGIELLQLTGGEPLLHPQINEALKIARDCFITAPIEIVTNGILLLRMPDPFWQICRENKITIVVTKYPINIDHQGIKEKAAANGVEFHFYGDTEQVLKTMHCVPLDLNGRQNKNESFTKCYKSNLCIKCRNGKLYTCSLIPNIHYFNNYFNLNLRVSKRDHIDIYKARDLDEIFEFIRKPIPFCKYCNIDGSRYDIKWDVSKRELTEWV